MLKLHHLERSRSTRILWLMEELALPYELVAYQRDPQTARAPASLHGVHPIGKAPILEDGALTIAESGAIIEYVVDAYGAGDFAPARGSADHARYLEWLHFAEGTAIFPVMLQLLGAWMGPLPAPMQAFAQRDIDLILDRIAKAVEAGGYVMASGFTAADIQIGYVVGLARMGGMIGARPALQAYLDRLEARPAYARAIEKGGPHYMR